MKEKIILSLWEFNTWVACRYFLALHSVPMIFAFYNIFHFFFTPLFWRGALSRTVSRVSFRAGWIWVRRMAISAFTNNQVKRFLLFFAGIFVGIRKRKWIARKKEWLVEILKLRIGKVKAKITENKKEAAAVSSVIAVSILVFVGGLEALGWTFAFIDIIWKYISKPLGILGRFLARFLPKLGFRKGLMALEGGIILWIWSKIPDKYEKEKLRLWFKWRFLGFIIKGRGRFVSKAREHGSRALEVTKTRANKVTEKVAKKINGGEENI